MNLYKVVHESHDEETGESVIQEKLVTATDFETCCRAELLNNHGYEHCLELKSIIWCGSVSGNHIKLTE